MKNLFLYLFSYLILCSVQAEPSIAEDNSPEVLSITLKENAEPEAMPLSITLKTDEAEDEEAMPLTITLVEEDIPAELDEGPYPVDITPNGHDDENVSFTDVPMIRNISVPEWFQLTFLNLPDDLDSALEKDKIGLIVYFGQVHCAYCDALKKVVFARDDIKQYMSRYFDVVAVDVWGELPVTTMTGEKTTELEFANTEKTNFTPSLIFYDQTGKETLRLRGYYPPYVFRAALDFVVGRSYLEGSFESYMNQKFNQPKEVDASQTLIKNPLFTQAPYLFDRSTQAAKRPLAVIFGQPQCHNCERFHSDILTDEVIYKRLQNMDVVQLNMWSDTPILTPSGEKLSAKDWAKKLGIFFTPSLLFFDEQGKEIIRIDSVIQRIRFNQILKFVLEKGYLEQPIFERWISKQLTVEDENPS